MYSTWDGVRKFFGGNASAAERFRKQERALSSMIREIERLERPAERNRAKLLQDMRKSTDAGHESALNIQTRDLARSLRHSKKMKDIKGRLEDLKSNIVHHRSNQVIINSMKETSKVMANMNKSANPGVLQKMWMDFERESDRMEMTQEMLGDAMDDATEEDVEVDVDKEVQDIVEKMRADSQIRMKHAAPSAPEGLTSTDFGDSRIAQPVGEGDPGDNDLEARLSNLKRGKLE